jgi:hypothetical protein
MWLIGSSVVRNLNFTASPLGREKIFAHSGNSSRIAAPAPRGRASRSGLGSPKMMAKKALYRYQSMAEVIPPA